MIEVKAAPNQYSRVEFSFRLKGLIFEIIFLAQSLKNFL